MTQKSEIKIAPDNSVFTKVTLDGVMEAAIASYLETSAERVGQPHFLLEDVTKKRQH